MGADLVGSNPLLKKFSDIQGTLATPQAPPINIFRSCRARLRLLQAAAHYRATGEVLPLEDPYGDRINTSNAPARLKLWSVGGDGVDDSGTGVWDPRKGKDIVLEVDR
jgi:hypothetical protein